MPEVIIETIYRARIHFSHASHDGDAISDAAFAHAGGMNVEYFQGNPACEPYVQAESDHEEAIMRWMSEVEARAKENRHERQI